jgi:hypothetical protein
MDITVYTVIIGNYDNLRPPMVYEKGIRYVCLTNMALNCSPWEIMPAPMIYKSDSRNSRIPKILSHLFFKSEFTIYHDGQYSLNAEPSKLIESLLSDADISLYSHPRRKSVYEEEQACNRYNIGGPRLSNQVGRYRKARLGNGLWAGGFIARRSNQAVCKFNECWWKEYIEGSTRDQIALPMALRMSGIRVNSISDFMYSDKKRVHLFDHGCDNKYDPIMERTNCNPKLKKFFELSPQMLQE